MAKMDELFTPYEQRAALAEPRPPRVVRVRLHVKGDERYYELNNWLRVPAWARHLDGRTIGQVAAALALALLALAGAGWVLWRFLFGARR